MPGDEELGFEAAVAALGMKTTVSEAEHPLLCEGTRREKGDLALALMITYKDDQAKLKKILDKLLDRESQTHKPQTLSSFYSSSRPATASQRSPSKHGGPSAPGALQPLTSGSAGPAQPGSVTGAGPGPTEGFTEKNVPGEVGALGRGDEWYGAMLGSPFPGSSQCPIFPTRQFPTFPLRGSPI